MQWARIPLAFSCLVTGSWLTMGVWEAIVVD